MGGRTSFQNHKGNAVTTFEDPLRAVSSKIIMQILEVLVFFNTGVHTCIYWGHSFENLLRNHRIKTIFKIVDTPGTVLSKFAYRFAYKFWIFLHFYTFKVLTHEYSGRIDSKHVFEIVHTVIKNYDFLCLKTVDSLQKMYTYFQIVNF